MKIDPRDIDRQGFEQRHREAMLNCILAWARFESQFRAMLSAVEKRPLDEGAKLYNRLQLSLGWTKLYQALRDRGAVPAVLERIRTLEAHSKEHVQVRQYIAHAGCVGVLRSDPQYIVFAPYESIERGEMIVLATPIEEIDRSTAWANGAADMANRIITMAGH